MGLIDILVDSFELKESPDNWQRKGQGLSGCSSSKDQLRVYTWNN